MKPSITNLIAEIKQERQGRRQSAPMQAPVSQERLRKLLDRGRELDYSFPAAYLDVLSIVDGIDSNGIVLYASETQPLAGHTDRLDYTIEGIVEANLIWRNHEPNKNFVFFAEAGDMVYCHDLTTDKFQIMDRIAQDVDDESDLFGTCEELLEKIFNHMLDRYGEVGEE